MVIDEYGSLDGIVTQTDLLEAIASDLPDTENEERALSSAMTARY
jgi:putative hemolysin